MATLDNNPQATQAANAQYLAANPNAFGTPAPTPTLANGQQAGGLAAPSPTPVQTSSQTSPAQQALATAQASGPAPQNSGDARTAVQNYLPTTTPTFYKPTTPVAGYDPQTVFDSNNKALSYDQFIAAGGKSDFSNVLSSSPPTQNPMANIGLTSPVVDQQLDADPGYQQLLADRAEYNSVANQSKSLVDTYNQFVKDAGIPGMNTELLNSQKIIDGTEEDIRKEVQAVNGFATDSQVLGLANARNKSLIKNYNNLLAAKTMAQEQVNNMVGLAGQDRQFALSSITQKMQIDQQINEYRDKFINNAKEGYNNIIKAIGYAGLYSSLQADPNSIPIVERTLGLAPGQLATLAFYKKPLTETEQLDLDAKKFQLAQAKAEAPLDLKLKQAQLSNVYSEISARNKPKAPNTQIIDLNGTKTLINSDTGEIIKQIGTGQTGAQQIQQQAQSKGNIDLITGLLKDKGLNSAVGPNYLARFSIGNQLTGVKNNFIAGVQQLTGQLTLDSLVRAKAQGATFGALSEGEMNVLSSSASKLNSWAIKKDGNVTGYNVDEKSFRTELDKINNFAKLDFILKGGDPNQVGVQTMPDGTYWTKNSNGTMTQL